MRSGVFGSVGAETTGRPRPAGGQGGAALPFRLLVLGDFSGRASRGPASAPGALAPRRIDLAPLDVLCSALRPRLRMSNPGPEGGTLELEFTNLDDFHPDQLLRRYRPLARLRELRGMLSNPAMAQVAIQELRPWLPAEALPAPSGSQAAATGGAVASTSAVDSPKTTGTSKGRSTASEAVNRLLRNIASPRVATSGAPPVAQIQTTVDGLIAKHLRAVLQAPAFRSLETAWRSLDFLIRGVKAERGLEFWVVDVSLPELAADLEQHPAPEQSAFGRMLLQPDSDVPWAAVVADCCFGPGPDSLACLGQIARACSAAAVRFIAGTSPALVGCERLDDEAPPERWQLAVAPETKAAWDRLRRMPEARWIGLALPRFLLRLPYGQDTDPIQAMEFEELLTPGKPDELLWGCSAFLVGYLLARAFLEGGCSAEPNTAEEITDVPYYAYRIGGETQVMPGAEAWLTSHCVQILVENGLIPVLSLKGRNSIRVVALQSPALAAPPTTPETAQALPEQGPAGGVAAVPEPPAPPAPAPAPVHAAAGDLGRRALAAVIFTDAVSFSRRASENEELALVLLNRDLKLMGSITERHGGQVLKSTGDGLLISFQSAIQAVGCALEIQQALARFATTIAPEHVLLHRIGIHLGDVFITDHDVMGDSVNIAARLQTEAKPGGICVSQTVLDVVRHQLVLQATPLGARELKNIRGTMPIYEIAPEEPTTSASR